MEVDYALLCQMVSVAPNGSLTVVNGDLDQLNVVQIPEPPNAQSPGTTVFIAPISLAAKIVFDPNESGKEYDFRVRMLDPKGNVIVDDARKVNIFQAPDPETVTKFNFVLQLQAINWPAPGWYKFEILVDGNVKKTKRFKVVFETQESAPASKDGK